MQEPGEQREDISGISSNIEFDSDHVYKTASLLYENILEKSQSDILITHSRLNSEGIRLYVHDTYSPVRSRRLQDATLFNMKLDHIHVWGIMWRVNYASGKIKHAYHLRRTRSKRTAVFYFSLRYISVSGRTHSQENDSWQTLS